MRRFIDTDGRPADRVWLEAGEPIPFACDCGEMYQVEEQSEQSVCPSCARTNIHGAQFWRRIEEIMSVEELKREYSADIYDHFRRKRDGA